MGGNIAGRWGVLERQANTYDCIYGTCFHYNYMYVFLQIYIEPRPFNENPHLSKQEACIINSCILTSGTWDIMISTTLACAVMSASSLREATISLYKVGGGEHENSSYIHTYRISVCSCPIEHTITCTYVYLDIHKL